MNKQEDIFKKLREINIAPFVKQKQNGKMNYLSWAVAWRLVIELFPDSTYELIEFTDEMPCKVTPFGIFVKTTVTIGGLARSMTLPVLDGANKSLKLEASSYKAKDYQTKKMVDKPIEAVTAFDVNKAQMRCLVKNLAVFGLGLDLYIGMDLPADLQLEQHEEEKQDNKVENKAVTGKDVAQLAQQKGIELEAICKGYKKNALVDFTEEELLKAYNQLRTKADAKK